MPLYSYQCTDCSERDQRVAGLDDHIALCSGCGGLMLRLDEDIFTPYFEPFKGIEEDNGNGIHGNKA